MIPAHAFQALCALQGGLHMSMRLVSADAYISPAQVWSTLSADLRTRTIGLLAQLAVNVMLTRSLASPSGKETSDVHPPTRPQTAS
jgi:hypothetical protein